jgi:hypothetical protein
VLFHQPNPGLMAASNRVSWVGFGGLDGGGGGPIAVNDCHATWSICKCSESHLGVSGPVWLIYDQPLDGVTGRSGIAC